MYPRFRPILLLALTLAFPGASLAEARPARIVSLGLCSDQLLLLLAGREQIAALSNFATDTQMSYFHRRARGLPLTDASVEDVIRHRPDLVITNRFTARAAARMLRRLGYRVEELPLARSIDDIATVLRRVGEWTGNRESAERAVAAMRGELESIRRAYAARPRKSIVIYTPNGFAVGSQTLEDAMLRQAGYRNLAGELGIVGFQPLSLEALLAADPDVIQLNDNLAPGNSLALSQLRHPALRRLGAGRLLGPIPTRLRICAGPMISEAVEWLAARR